MAQGRKRSRTGGTHRKSPKDLRDWDIIANPDGPKPERKPRPKARRRSEDPVPIEKIDPSRTPPPPRTGRTEGWSRNNNDALPRGRREP